MSQESTLICLDNSEWMRNGDMSPTRLQCQQEAIRVLIQFKLRSNPENAVGLLSMAKAIHVLASMTTEDRKVLSRLHQVQIGGSAQVIRAIKTAHLVLKNRPNRNHKTRIVVFIGSPLDELEAEYGEGEFSKLAKRLKKENVKCDFVLFGEATAENNQVILDFVDTLNGRDGSGSNVVVVPGDAKLFEALLSSPICRNEDGTGGGDFDFGMDGDDDPELALALRVSLEEQRQRQQQEAQQAQPEAQPAAMDVEQAGGAAPLAVPLHVDPDSLNPVAMTEEEQIEWALRMSMMQDEADAAADQQSGGGGSGGTLLKPVAIYSGSGGPSSAIVTQRELDEDALSSAGATASGTPAPTPMETDATEKEEQHSSALGQLMDNPDLLRQLVDQIPGGTSSGEKEGEEKDEAAKKRKKDSK